MSVNGSRALKGRERKWALSSRSPLPQILLLGDSAGAGVFVGIFPVFAGKNLVLIGESQYNYRVAAPGASRFAGTLAQRFA